MGNFPAYNFQRGATWLPVPMDEGMKADVEDNLQKRNHLNFKQRTGHVEKSTYGGKSTTEELKATFDKLLVHAQAATAEFHA